MFPIEPFMVQPCLLVASLACPILPTSHTGLISGPPFSHGPSSKTVAWVIRSTWTILLSTCSSVYSPSFSLSSEGTSSRRKTRSYFLVKMLPQDLPLNLTFPYIYFFFKSPLCPQCISQCLAISISYLFIGCAGSQLWHAGSSSLTRDQTQAPCVGNVESQPLEQQGSPIIFFL